VSLFTTLSKISKLKLTTSKFYKNIVEYYLNIYEKEKSGEKNNQAQQALTQNINSISKNNLVQFENFIKGLPGLSIIRKILNENLLLEKEIIIMKIILDIYEHYFTRYDYPLYQKLLDEYIPTAMEFYSILLEDEIFLIYDKLNLVNQANELLSKIITIKSINFYFFRKWFKFTNL
jgi:hypothetical protein